jgi:WD40 repeat protein
MIRGFGALCDMFPQMAWGGAAAVTQREGGSSRYRQQLMDLTRPGFDTDMADEPASHGFRSWAGMCAAAVRSGNAQAVDSLAAMLDDGQAVARAFSEGEKYWPGRRGAPDDGSGGPRTSAARALLAAADAAVHWDRDQLRAQASLKDAMARWQRACVLPEGPASLGYPQLVLMALSGMLPATSHRVHAAVVFGAGAPGAHGKLTLAVQPGGSPGLYPDPRSMAFFAADQNFAGSLEAAWRNAPSAIRNRCVVWDVSGDDGPFRWVDGGSLGAAFGVALSDLARAARPAGKARVRRLDPRCAVTGRLSDDGRLLPVGDYAGKFRAASRQGWRIVVPADDPDAAKHPDIKERDVAYARDLPDAIRKSRLLRLRPHGIIAMIVVLALAAVGAGAGWAAARSGERVASNQAAHRLDIEVSDEVASRSEALGESDPALARLLSIAAWRISPTDQARYAMLTAAAWPATGILTGLTYGAASVAFSPDGKTLASGSYDDTIRLWDVATGRTIRILTGHTGVYTVAFSPDGKTLASGGADDSVRLWDVATGRTIRILTSHIGEADSVAFSPDGKILASGNLDHTVRLWDVATGRTIRILTGHTGAVSSVAFSPDGKTLATGTEDARLWDVATGRLIRVLTGHTSLIDSVAFSPDGETLATGSTDRTVRLWDVATGLPEGTLTGHTDYVDSVAFSPDGKTLASSSYDGTVRLWNAAVGRPLTGTTGDVDSAAFSPDGKTLAGSSGDDTIRLWNAANGQLISTLFYRFSIILSVAFSPDGTTLASGTNDDTVWLWDVATRHVTSRLTGHFAPVSSVAFSADGKTLAGSSGNGGIGTDDDTVRLWDVATGRTIRILTSHTGGISSVAFSPDGKTLAGGTDEGTVTLWDVATGRIEDSLLTNPTGGISSVAFSPNGKTLVTGNVNDSVTLWDVATGRPIGNLTGHTAPVSSVAFSPDGKTLASGSSDGTVRLWDISYINDPAAYLCAMRGALSRAEWAQWVPPGLAYRDICP